MNMVHLFILLFLFGDGVCEDASERNSGKAPESVKTCSIRVLYSYNLITMAHDAVINSSCSTVHIWFEILSVQTLQYLGNLYSFWPGFQFMTVCRKYEYGQYI